jgi:hypothetical protein
MPRFYRKVFKKAGLSPGTLIAEKKVDGIKLSLFDYDVQDYHERELKKVEESFPFKEKPTVGKNRRPFQNTPAGVGRHSQHLTAPQNGNL